MSKDHLQFLKENFIIDYEEAVEEYHEELPLGLHFQEILEILNQNTITSSTPITMKRPLYGLKFALAECVMLQENEREKEMERKAQNKKSLPSVSGAYNFVKNHWFLFKTRRNLLSIKKQLLQDMRADADDAATHQNSVRVHQPWDYQFFLKKEIYGFNDHLQKIEAFLLDDGSTNSYGIKTLGIIGMGGSGKTALAKKVFCRSRVQESFYPMIWLELPQSPIPLQSIVTAVCESFSSYGMNDHDNDLGNLLGKMHNCLLNTKYLIVLDGVWHASDWFLGLNSNSNLQMEGNTFCNDHFQHGLPKESGGAIIITSRFQDVATEIVGEQNLYHLEPTLDKDSCWSLILDSIPRKPYPPSMLRMKDEMVDRCDGLPLAAKALAEIVSVELKKKSLQDPRISSGNTLLFWLRINKPPQIPISEVLEYIRTYQGVYYADIYPDQNNEEVEVRAETFFNTLGLVKSLMKFSCKAEVILKIYYIVWERHWDDQAILGEKIAVSMLPHTIQLFKQQLNMNHLSPSLISDGYILSFFLDPNATKAFCWRVDDSYCYCNGVLQFLKTHPDVSQARITNLERGKFEIRVETYYNPLEVMKDLEKHNDTKVLDSRIELYYGQGMNRIRNRDGSIIKLWSLPQMIQEEINSQINTDPPSPSPSHFVSCIFKLFQDSSITKRFRLRFDKYDDRVPSSKIIKKILICPGVDHAYIDSGNINEIIGEGRCNLLKLIRDLSKLIKAEIISFLKMS